MDKDEPTEPSVEFKLSTLDSIYEENPQPDSTRQLTTRRHSALALELDAFDRHPENPLNRARSEIVADLNRIIEVMKMEHE